MGGHAEKCITATVAYILKCPASTVPQAMRACKFSDKESKNVRKQMAVRRACDKAMAGKKRAFPPNVIDESTVGKKSVSLLTTAVTRDTTPSTPTMPSGMRSTRSSPRLAKQKPMPKLIRRNLRAMQKVQVNKLAMGDFEKCALKRATKWYAWERNCSGGLSSYQIKKKVKQEYGGVGPTTLGHWEPRMGRTRASSSQKWCKPCLVINLTLFLCAYNIVCNDQYM